MSRKRQQTDPLATMAAANPISAAELAAEIGEVSLEQALKRSIERGGAPATLTKPQKSLYYKDFRGFGVGLGLAAVAVLAALLVASGWPGGAGNGRPEFAAAAIRVAEANPRLLVTAPGWTIIRADEFEPDSGELEFSDGSHRFEVHWYPAGMYERYLRDRATVSPPERGTLLGEEATTVEYSPEEYATMLAPQGSVFVEVRGRLGGRAAYEEILDSLRPVDVETWLAAMPPSTVRPEARAEAVERMLQGIPLPPGFDPGVLQGEGSIADSSSLAVKVGNAVACGWVESWIAARAGGDDGAARRAVDAIASWREWPIVRETKVPWFGNYAIATKQLRAGRLDRSDSVYETTADGRTFGYGPAWRLLLGCGGTHHREVDGVPGER